MPESAADEFRHWISYCPKSQVHSLRGQADWRGVSREKVTPEFRLQAPFLQPATNAGPLVIAVFQGPKNVAMKKF